MDVYILDNLFRRQAVFDKYDSLIWTERFNKVGDFEFHIHSTLKNRNALLPGTRLSIVDSDRVMTIKTVEDTTSEDGKPIIKVKGFSLEEVLNQRLARGTMGDLTATPKWTLTGPPADILRQMFHDICVTGILNPADVIPYIVEDSLYPPSTIPEPSTSVVYEIDPMMLYQAMSDLADVYDLGFRMVRDPVTLQVYFDVYTGSDRTTKQNILPAVVFSTGMDNLHNTTEFTTIQDYKNVAYVLSKVGSEVVYPLDIDPAITGFERNVLLVKADDIEDTDPMVASARMIQRGLEELAKHRRYSGFDGELSRNSKYKYGTHYNLGDLVELRNTNGFATDMQVTEQIFVSDKEGQRAYPTLSISQFITPGSWLGWDANEEWEEVGPTEYWDNQP